MESGISTEGNLINSRQQSQVPSRHADRLRNAQKDNLISRDPWAVGGN